jgi:GNAT superfamily N-acetyltransferase
MKIRSALKTDLPEIIELTRQLGYSVNDTSFESNFDTIIDNPCHAIFVAEDSDRNVIAYIHVLPKGLLISPDTFEIGELIVDEHYRRKGIGMQLVEIAERWVVEHGHEKIIVGSSTKRTTSHQFYSDIGYEFWKEQIVYMKVIK